MSENPYAPPSAELGALAGGRALEGRGDFDIGQCLSEAWTNTWANFPLWLGAGVVWLLATLLAMVSVIGWLLLPALAWGGAWFALRMHDGEAEFGDVFAGFSRFGATFLPMLGLFLIFLGLGLVSQSVQIAGELTGNETLVNIGTLIVLAFTLLVTPRLMFSYYFVVDREMGAVEGVTQSWTRTSACKWKVIVLYLLSFVVAVAGLLVLIVGIIPASVMTYLMFTSAYRQITGRPARA